MLLQPHFSALFLVLCFLPTGLFSQQRPAPPQSEPISIIGATAHTGTGALIENSLIVFENGIIQYVGPLDQDKIRGREIDARGKHLYPGFIAPNTTLGLVEIDAVEASDDKDELGSMLPHVRALIAYNAESKVVESMRPNGVLMAQVCPRGGRISGRSSIVQLDAWNWEDAAIRADDGVHINWPESFSRKRWWAGEGRGHKPNKEYAKQIRELDDLFDEAQAYLQGDRKENNLMYDALEEVLEGSAGVFVHAHGKREILDAIAFQQRQGVDRLIIVGGAEAHKVSAELVKNDVPVLLRRVHSTPRKEDEAYDLPYRLPSILHEAGVTVALQSSGRMERMNTRNLPFYAGTAVAYGLDREAALQMISLNAAVILGIDDQCGSLEAGKDATLFISEGDALDMAGNQLSHAFIQGRAISLETHQTELYERYRSKYRESGRD